MPAASLGSLHVPLAFCFPAFGFFWAPSANVSVSRCWWQRPVWGEGGSSLSFACRFPRCPSLSPFVCLERRVPGLSLARSRQPSLLGSLSPRSGAPQAQGARERGTCRRAQAGFAVLGLSWGEGNWGTVGGGRAQHFGGTERREPFSCLCRTGFFLLSACELWPSVTPRSAGAGKSAEVNSQPRE